MISLFMEALIVVLKILSDFNNVMLLGATHALL